MPGTGFAMTAAIAAPARIQFFTSKTFKALLPAITLQSPLGSKFP
jgi:hypothetical protein